MFHRLKRWTKRIHTKFKQSDTLGQAGLTTGIVLTGVSIIVTPSVPPLLIVASYCLIGIAFVQMIGWGYSVLS